jgi:hypothetical protein
MSVEMLRKFKRLGRTTVLKKHLLVKRGCAEDRLLKGVKIGFLGLRARESRPRAVSSLGLDYDPFSYS